MLPTAVHQSASHLTLAAKSTLPRALGAWVGASGIGAARNMAVANSNVDKKENTEENQLVSKQEDRFFPLRPFFGRGFDDFFAPSPFFKDDPFFKMMPLLNTRLDDTAAFRALPNYEISQEEGTYKVSVDLPGVKASDMTIELENEGRVLHISGGRKVTKENSVSETKFDKMFTIGDNIDTEKITANLANGVLVLTAPMKEVEEIPKITIPITEGAE